MSEEHGVSRRALLAAMAAGALLARTATIARASEEDVTELLLSLLSNRGEAAVVGAHWARRGGPLGAPAVTVNGLIENLRRAGWDGGDDRNDLRLRFNAAVQADYQAGDLVVIDGWQIARTQAELCALAYFSKAGLI